jgi:prepilin-type processing-associated H-X9-DG protein
MTNHRPEDALLCGSGPRRFGPGEAGPPHGRPGFCGPPAAAGSKPGMRAPARIAFSLIELLIVIATLSLLCSIVLPALGRAREEGRGAHCMATLHNAGMAMTAYFDDHEGSFWPYYVDLPAPEHGRRWWFGLEPNGPPTSSWQTNRFLDKSAGFLSAYLSGSAQDFRCVSFPYGDGKYFPKFSPPAGGYGYNIAALAGLDPSSAIPGQPRRIQQFGAQAAEVFALADGVHFDRLSYSGHGPLEQPFNEPAYIQWQNPAFFGSNAGVNGGYAHFRHNGRAMVLFLDSHAGGQPPRRPRHPYSRRGYGPVANLSDESLRARQITRGTRTVGIDVIYGLK